MVRNIHFRDLKASIGQVSELIDNLGSENDIIWPKTTWPAMKFDRPLGNGATGGHGRIRYFVEDYTPGRQVVFRFTRPVGFHGIHEFTIKERDPGIIRLEHEINMKTKGLSRFYWLFVIKWLHDALIEDALDLAELHITSDVQKKRKWSTWVKFLRKLLTFRKRKSKR